MLKHKGLDKARKMLLLCLIL